MKAQTCKKCRGQRRPRGRILGDLRELNRAAFASMRAREDNKPLLYAARAGAPDFQERMEIYREARRTWKDGLWVLVLRTAREIGQCVRELEEGLCGGCANEERAKEERTIVDAPAGGAP